KQDNICFSCLACPWSGCLPMNKKITEIIISGKELSVPQIVDVARGKVKIRLSEDPAFRNRIDRSRQMLLAALHQGTPVYGVNTGYGKSCDKRMDMEASLKNSLNIIKFHGCGTGAHIGIPETRAAMLARILCFSRGYS